MKHGRRPMVLSLLLCAGLGVATSACGADEPQATPRPASSSTSASTGEEPAASADPDASTDSTTTPPATGPRVRLPVLQVRLPDADWVVSSVDGGFGSGFAGDGSGQLFVNQFPDISRTPDLDATTRIRLEQVKEHESFPVAFGEDLVLDGVDARTIEGSGAGVHLFMLKALLSEPEQLSITLELRTTGTRALHRERVEAVLASWRWR